MAVKPVIGFGLAVIGGGLFWMVIQEELSRYIGTYILNTADKFYVVSKLVWDAIPFAVIIVGIIVLVFGGLSQGQEAS